MIALFPMLHEDELLYSAWSRYADQMQYDHTSAVLDDLFGTSFIKISMDLPARLRTFVERLPYPQAYTVDELIDRHTLLPFYAAFLPAKRIETIRQLMSDDGKAIHSRAGISATRVPGTSWLRFCPQCVGDDRQRWGSCYWHRVHQAPGVLVCPHHYCWLENSLIRFNQGRGKTFFISAEQAVYECSARPVDESNCDQRYLHQIAEDIAWLLQQRAFQADIQVIRQRYDRLLFERGLSSYRGTVKVDAVLQEFATYYPPSFFTLLGIAFDATDRRNWLARLTTDKHVHHPLQHLLLMRFLGYSAATFFAKPTTPTPFGTPLWPCLNPVCHHYQQLVIKTYDLVFSLNTEQGQPIGIFACSCGFTYTRTGPDESEGDRWRKTRIQSYGAVWESVLRTGWEDPEMTIKQLAHILKTDPATVKRNAARLGLPFERTRGAVALLSRPAPSSPVSGTPPNRTQLEAHQAVWLTAVETNPLAGVAVLKQQHPQSYATLYRYAPQWLAVHTPHAPRHFPSRENTTPIDLPTRDKQVAAAVYQAALDIKNEPGRPIQITMNSIFIKLGKRGLLQQRHRLPRTLQAFAEVVESFEQFTIRRIFYIAHQCREESIPLTRARLLDFANAWSYVKQPAVEAALAHVLYGNILERT